jgi:selenide,water dikinase
MSAADDAAIYRLSDDLALVQTVDFFPPVVDDPYSYGAIAAANAVSDVYAMGGRPLTGLNIICFPAACDVPHSILVDILRGGADKAAEAGFSIVGGHTLQDKEPKYGLAITGVIHPKRILTKGGAKVGDELILTKPLGIGIITTAIKAECVSEETIQRAIRVMSTLNKTASEVMLEIGVNACTDITGFGLLGHLHEVVMASGIGARINLSKVPVLKETWELVAEGLVPAGTHRNLDFVKDSVVWDAQISEDAKLVLCDAQTSGGLLISVPGEKSQQLITALHQAGVAEAVSIGTIIEDKASRIYVVP